MKRIVLSLKETANELIYKVTWPSWEDLQSSAVVVMVASLVIAMIVWGMDQASNFVLGTYYHSFD